MAGRALHGRTGPLPVVEFSRMCGPTPALQSGKRGKCHRPHRRDTHPNMGRTPHLIAATPAPVDVSGWSPSRPRRNAGAPPVARNLAEGVETAAAGGQDAPNLGKCRFRKERFSFGPVFFTQATPSFRKRKPTLRNRVEAVGKTPAMGIKDRKAGHISAKVLKRQTRRTCRDS